MPRVRAWMDLIGPGVGPASGDTASADGGPRRVVPCRERGYRGPSRQQADARRPSRRRGGLPPASGRLSSRRARHAPLGGHGPAVTISITGTPVCTPFETERARDERSIGNEHRAKRQPLRDRPPPHPGELHAAHPADVHRTRRRGLARPSLGHRRRAPLHLGRDVRTLPPPRLGACATRHRRRRLRGGLRAERPGDLRGQLRRADARRGAQHHQRPARPGGYRVHPGARRGEGAAHRPRVLAGDRGRARPDGAPAAGHRRRRRPRCLRGAHRRDRVRGVPRRGRSRVLMVGSRR